MSKRRLIFQLFEYGGSRPQRWWLLLVVLALLLVSWFFALSEASLVAPYLYPLF